MTILTQLSLNGFIATVPELTFIGNGRTRFYARVGIEQWRQEPDDTFTKIDPAFCAIVAFSRLAKRAYDRFRVGNQFVAAGYVHEYERTRNGHTVPDEEFVARRLGHDSHGTRYAVERTPPDTPRLVNEPAPPPAIGL